MFDGGSRAATDAHQWCVTISRGRKQVLVFTPDKEALRVQVQAAEERELALDLKLGDAQSVDVRQSEWTRRAVARGRAIRLPKPPAGMMSWFGKNRSYPPVPLIAVAAFCDEKQIINPAGERRLLTDDEHAWHVRRMRS